jgi:hypothetical protein
MGEKHRWPDCFPMCTSESNSGERRGFASCATTDPLCEASADHTITSSTTTVRCFGGTRNDSRTNGKKSEMAGCWKSGNSDDGSRVRSSWSDVAN